jgi:CheY-like chemotaxis protein
MGQARDNPVLLVDDHEDVRDGLRRILEADGWRVETAGDGREALHRLLGGLRPCVILYDLTANVMNGVEFRREQLAHAHLRAIALVTYAGLTDVQRQADEVVQGKDPVLQPEIGRIVAAVRQHCFA